MSSAVSVNIRPRRSLGALELSKIRKMAPDGFWQEKRNRWVPLTANSFGLPAGTTCPGKTEFCVDCYAMNSENSKGVAAKLQRNYERLLDARTVERMAKLLTELLGVYMAREDRRHTPMHKRLFRWHWSGDVYSLEYAEALRIAMLQFPIRQWIYTRSFLGEVNAVPVLYGIPNLALYLSVDQYNVHAVPPLLEQYPKLLLANCAEDYRSAREIAVRRAINCPENTGQMALMTDGVGACVRCRICVDGKMDINFSTAHVEDVSLQLQMELGEALYAEGRCANPDCGKPTRRKGKRGRPPKWCSNACRAKIYHRRKAQEARQGAIPTP